MVVPTAKTNLALWLFKPFKKLNLNDPKYNLCFQREVTGAKEDGGKWGHDKDASLGCKYRVTVKATVPLGTFY